MCVHFCLSCLFAQILCISCPLNYLVVDATVSDIMFLSLQVSWMRGSVGLLASEVSVDPDSKVHGADMGPSWGRQDAGGPHVGPMNFVIW